MPRLSEDEIHEALAGLAGWHRQGGEIAKTFSCGSFRKAIALVDAVADAAEAINHHPDIDIRYARVTFRLTTHDLGGLTEKDVQLAREIDRLAGRL